MTTPHQTQDAAADRALGQTRPRMPMHLHTDAVVIGAGFAGLYMLHSLRGLGLSAVAFEAGNDVGGTWYWNRYPGARCDVESLQYSYSWTKDLQQEWQWTERYAQQSEIQAYIRHAAERYDLLRDIRFQTRVTEADWDEDARLWTVRTDVGDEVRARFVISAAGCLSIGRVPDVPGLADFQGRWYHTGQWPHETVDFTDLRVAVIGTGSSGVQCIPVIARQAAQLTVFQRTANFSIPAHNRPLTRGEQRAFKADYDALRQTAKQSKAGILYDYATRATFDVDEVERQAEFERRWARGGPNFVQAFNDLALDRTANDQAAEFVRRKIRAAVRDPKTAELLCPKDHAIGTKRICVDSAYHDTFNLPHVSLVDLRAAPITRIQAGGIRCADGTLHALDAIVFATGYDAVTGAFDQIAYRRRGGRALKAHWAEGPRTYLGLMSAGFPNLFMLTGPQSPSILTNVVMAIEQHVELVTRCLADLQRRGASLIEPTAEAETDWVAHVAEVAARTLHGSANSWYTGANVPGKPRVFLPYIGGLGVYTRRCDDVAADGWRGFAIDADSVQALT